MIPILYESTETAFTSNGLGRLHDCISCKVTEERNGVYECDFEYPVDGLKFDSIICGRIIGVTHDDTGDIQPFDIVSYSKPIDGIVTFHATHISYRQSFLTVKTPSAINSLADAFTLLRSSTPANPFTYQTDKDSTGYLGAANRIPRTVRQLLGGIEGSILDAYGGEYEFDKWTVSLWNARGQLRPFTIRYGVNMTSFEDETDINGTYSQCIPYWTNGEETVVGNLVTSNGVTIVGRDECVPLDLSEYYENPPTTGQLTSKATTLMNRRTPYNPTQTIKVSFARLQDMGYEDLNNLLLCHLCDTIKVVFPFYNMSGTFKIVRTVWDVLSGRYDSMELGSLSVSLAQALGVESNNSDSTKTNTNALLKTGGTMTGQLLTSFKNSVATGSYQASANTVPDLLTEVRYSSGVMGSVYITTAYTYNSITIPTGWYNFLYVPHRSGGVNGTASGDNCNYGHCVLWAMTASDGAYSIRFSSSAIADLQYTDYQKYIRTSSGGLDWTNQTEGDSKLLAKSALAFWDGTYNGTGSNLSKCAYGTILGTNTVKDYVIERGLTSNWYYRKWNSGKVEAWRTYNAGSQTPSQWVTGWYYKDFTVSITSGIFSTTPNTVIATNNGSDTQFMVFTARATSTTSISVRVVKPNSGAATPVIALYVCNMV